ECAPIGTYRLQAVVSHLGDSMDHGPPTTPTGHYISDTAEGEGQSWLSFSDLKVSRSTEPAILKSRTKTAYLIFYVHRLPRAKGKKKKGKKQCSCFYPTHAGESSILVGTLPVITSGESISGGFWGGPGGGPGSDAAESCLPSLDYRDPYDYDYQYPGSDSAGSYYPPTDYQEDYEDYSRSEEYVDVGLRSDTESDCSEDPSVEVEEARHEDPSCGL
ncbi:hypothetical protein P4O66_023102, partial [Electrophorus voltai]